MRNNNAEIFIADTGRGIAKEKLDDLFNFCFTADSSRIKMGIGLMTCYNNIQGHGGKIKVESKPGKGSVFTVTLPLKQETIKDY